MGEMREYFDIMREMTKERRAKRNKKFEPLLIELGAIRKSDAIYEYNGWFCYPTKGFAMNKYNTQDRMSLTKFIQEAQANTR